MRQVIALLFVLCGMGFAALPSCTKPIASIDTALVPKVIYVDQNDNEAYDCINEQGDTLRAILTALGGTTGSVGLSSVGDIKANIDRDSNTTGSRFWVANHTNDTLFRVSDDLAIKAYGAFNVVGASTLAALAATSGTYSGTLGVTGAVTMASTLGVTGVSTLTGNVLLGGKVSTSAGYVDGIYNAEATSGTYLQFNNGTTPITRLGAPGHATLAYNYLNLNTILGTDATPSYKLDVRGTFGATGAVTMASTATTTGVHTFTAAPVFSSVTASQFLLVDGSKALTSVAGTGTGSVMRSADPTSTGTLTAVDIQAEDIDVDETIAGSPASISVQHFDNTNTGSTSYLQLGTGGASGGDPYVRFIITSGQNWSLGTDNSDGDAFVITPSTTLGAATNGLKITTAGAVTIPGTLGVTGAATASTMALGGNEAFTYDEESFTATLTGCTTSPTVAVTYVKVGKLVTLMIPAVNATSNTTLMTLTGLPAAIQPATSRSVTLQNVMNNSVEVTTAFAYIGPSTAISFAIINAGAFTASGTKGLNQNVQLTYSLN